MAQELLEYVDRDALVETVDREAVPQRVRMNAAGPGRGYAGGTRGIAEDFERTHTTDRKEATILRLARQDEAGQVRGELRVYRDPPEFLNRLAPQVWLSVPALRLFQRAEPQLTIREINVLTLEAQDLADSGTRFARPPQQASDRAGSCRLGGFGAPGPGLSTREAVGPQREQSPRAAAPPSQ